MLTISVKNFGPIVEGSVDLKPLTIFVGPSNTGKSYMATAVYTLLKAFERIPVNTYGFYNRRLSDVPWFQPRDLREMRFDRDNALLVLESLREWTADIDLRETTPTDFLIRKMPDKAQHLAQNAADATVFDFLQALTEGIQSNFGVVKEIVRIPSESNSLSLTVRRRTPALAMTYEVQPGTSELKLHGSNVDVSNAYIERSDDIFAHHFASLKQVEDGRRLRQLENYYNLVAAISEAGTAEFFRNLPIATHYFPAARSGLMEGYKTVSSSILRRAAPSANLRGVTANFLGDLLLFDWRTTNRQYEELNRATKFIEEQVVRGSIDLDESAGLPYPDIVYLTSSGKFSLLRSSSMVSELAPVILFLKYLVGRGDLLILEEPESHLHPAAQRQLARGIVRLVNVGVKVLITTHSDFFVNQVNNLLRASYASKRWLRERGFAPEDTLKHDDVSAYLFRMDKDAGGSRIEELEIQRDIGIENPEFTEAINELYDETLLVERVRPK